VIKEFVPKTPTIYRGYGEDGKRFDRAVLRLEHSVWRYSYADSGRPKYGRRAADRHCGSAV
jgi:hypothetical protein